MTLQEAKDKCNEYEYLIGQMMDEDEISEFVVVPDNPDRSADIIRRAISDEAYEGLLIGYNEFNIVVIFNKEIYPYDGYLLTMQFQEFLERLNQQNDQ